MKKLLSTLMAISFTTLLYSQAEKDVPTFGKIDKIDLEMKECEFDKNAEAMVLFDVAELYCDIRSYNMDVNLDRHIRIKILKDKGLNKADIHIPFYSYRNNESIRNLTAQTYNLDAQGNIVVTKVDKKLIYEKKINSRYSEQAFTFPEVKAGTVIEYKYQLTNAGPANWYFQRSIPVKYSRYRTNFPNEIEMHSTPYCVLPYQSKKGYENSRNVTTFTMSNIPALRDEPYISCEEDYLQRIETQPVALNMPMQRVNLTRTWQKIIEDLMADEDFGRQLKKEIPRTADLDEQLKSITDPYRKMTIIHEYVRKNMEWNGYTNIWAGDGVKSAWKDKKGTSGEINLILINLLKDAGLTARAVLVSTRDHGRVATAMPGTQKFNKVMAYVTIDDKVYVLDATEKYTPSRLIPLEVMTTEGLVIEKLETSEWGWRVLWDTKQQYKETTILQAGINKEGKMEGEVAVYSYDYSRLERLPLLKKGKDKFAEEYFTLEYPGFQPDSLTIENETNDSLPLVQRMKFALPVNSSGDYDYFSLNLFTDFNKNPFVADNRFSDVFFGANQSYNIIASIMIPEGYVFETLPRNMRLIMPDTSISLVRRMASEKNQLSAQFTLEFKKPFYSVDEYPYFREFYKKMFDILNEQVAIRKEK